MACVIEVTALAEDFYPRVFRNRAFVLPPKLRVICSIALLYYEHPGWGIWSGAFDSTIKVKVKFILAEARKTRKEVRVQLYSLFNLGARWGWVVNATPRPLYPQERDSVRIEISLKILSPNIPEILLCSTTPSLSQVPVLLKDLKRNFAYILHTPPHFSISCLRNIK